MFCVSLTCDLSVGLILPTISRRCVTLHCTQTCTIPCLHWSCLGSLHAKLVDEPCLPGREVVLSKFVTVDVTNKDEEEQEEVVSTAC